MWLERPGECREVVYCPRFSCKASKENENSTILYEIPVHERLRLHAHMRVIHHTRNAHTTPAPPHQILIASASAQPPAHMRHTLTRISAHTTRSRPPATPGVHHSHRATRERWPPVALSHGGLQPRHRRGRALRALLAAAGRARRHALVIYEEQAPWTHGCAPPRPHRPQVHDRLSVMGHIRRASEVEIARSQGGWRGRQRRTRWRLSIAPDTTRMRRLTAGAAGRRSRAPPLEDQEIVGGEDGLAFFVPERGAGGDATSIRVNPQEQADG